jgi:hypothetical protein
VEGRDHAAQDRFSGRLFGGEDAIRGSKVTRWPDTRRAPDRRRREVASRREVRPVWSKVRLNRPPIATKHPSGLMARQGDKSVCRYRWQWSACTHGSAQA